MAQMQTRKNRLLVRISEGITFIGARKGKKHIQKTVRMLANLGINPKPEIVYKKKINTLRVPLLKAGIKSINKTVKVV